MGMRVLLLGLGWDGIGIWCLISPRTRIRLGEFLAGIADS